MRRGSGVVRAWPERLRHSAELADPAFLAKFPRNRAAEDRTFRERECSDQFLQPVPEVEVVRLHATLAAADAPVQMQRRRHLGRMHRRSRQQTVEKRDAAVVRPVGNSVEEIAYHARHVGHRQMPAEGVPRRYSAHLFLSCHLQADPAKQVNARKIASIAPKAVIQQQTTQSGIAAREGRSNT